MRTTVHRICVATALVGIWLPLSVRGFDLASDQNLAGSPSVLVGVGVGNTITNREITGGNLYDWADVNGDGTRNDPVATPGMNLLGYKLTNANGSHIVLNLAGGSITGTGSVAVATAYALGSSGRIEIQTTNDVDCGGLDTSAASAGSGHISGDILVGSTNARAGNIRVGFLTTRCGKDYVANPGSIWVYGSGHVKVMDVAGIPGDIQTWSGCHRLTGVPETVGSVTIMHDGDFVARNILTWHEWDNYSRGGHVFIDGDAAGDGADGVCMASNIYTYSSYLGEYGGRGGNVTIRGYSSVRIAEIKTLSGNGGTDAGDVTITNIAGAINVPGLIDLRNLSNMTRAGDLVMSAAGAITFVNLNLALLKSATVASPAGVYVEGIISNFPTASPANGVLDAPPGTVIRYKAKLPGNLYLAGNSDILKSGGKLRSESKGTVVIFK